MVLKTRCWTQKTNFLALKSNGQRTNQKSAKTNNRQNRRRETPRGSYEDPPKKRPCRFQQENAENNVNKHGERTENIQKRMNELTQMMLNIQKEQNKVHES